MTDSRTPVNIAYETEHCFVRELELSDASETICNWMANPETAKALNAPARALSLDDVRKYISGHDRINGHLLGIFERRSRSLIGFWSVYVDWQHREFLINVLVAERIEGELGALRETGRPLYEFMFLNQGLGAMCYNVLASNERVRSRLTRTPDHVSNVEAASGEGQETIHHFRTTRERWLQARATRPERDAEWKAKKDARRQSGA